MSYESPEARLLDLVTNLTNGQLAQHQQSWEHMTPQSLLASALKEMSTISLSMAEQRPLLDVLSEIGNVMAALGMLADVLVQRGYLSVVDRDVQTLAHWLVTTIPHELQDESVVATAQRLLEERYGFPEGNTH